MDFLALIAAVAALIWGVIALCRGGLLVGTTMVLMAGCVAGAPLFSVPSKPIPLTLDRLLWIVLLVQWIVWRKWHLTNSQPWGRSDKIMAALLVVIAISTMTHDWSAHNNQPAARFLFQWIMPAGLYLVAREARLSERGLNGLAITFGLFAVYLAITALAETREAWWAVYPQYIASSDVKEFLGRGRGPLLNPAGNGLYMSLGVAAWFLLWPRANRGGKLAALALAAICLAGVYSTLTRSVWMGAGLCTGVVLTLGVPKAWRKPIFGAGLVMVSLVVASQWENLLSFKRDKQLTAKETAESVKLRPILAHVAWNMFCDRPLMGCGFAQYLDQSVYYLHDRSTTLTLETARPYVQHNVLLSLLTETGIIGMGLFAALLTFWIIAAWRLCHAATAPPWVRRQGLLFLAMMGAYIPNAMFQDMTIISMVNSLLFFMAGVIAGLEPWTRPAVAQSSLPSISPTKQAWCPEMSALASAATKQESQVLLESTGTSA